MRLILALDCATATGWATNSPALEAGVQRFELRRGMSSGCRFLQFTDWMEAMLRARPLHLVVYEQPQHFKSAAAAEVCHGFVTRVQEQCERRGIEYRACYPATLKRFATGKGNAPKELVIAAAEATFPGYVAAADPGGDEADARWLLEWALQGCPEPAAATRGKRRAS